jgi:hypothetical protein
MQVKTLKMLAIGGAGIALGATAHAAVGNVLDTPEKRADWSQKLNIGGAAAGIAGLAAAALAPAVLRPLGIAVGIAGAAAFIGSQLLTPQGFSPSAE